MIPQAAVNEYLDRELDNHIWIKKLSRAELEKAISALRPRPNLYPKLRKHQLACFLLGVSYPQFAYWLDMGSGKTLLSLELLNYWHDCGKLKRALIFLKSDKVFPTWEKQIKRYGIELPYITLEGSSEQKWRQLEEFEEGLILVTRPGARAMLSKSVKVKKKNKWKLDNKLVEKFIDGVDAFVLDESTDDAHFGSLNYKIIDRIRRVIPIRYALAGRPFGRDPTLLWAQHHLIDGGETLGHTLGLFRAAFFSEEDSKYSDWAKVYTFRKSMQPELSRLLQHRSITYSEGECGDVPKFVPIIEEVKFPEEAGAYYQRAVESIIHAKGNYREIENVFLRMRQLSSGFVGFKDDETGDRAQVEFDDNPKFDRQMELLGEIPQDRKAVVFYDFTFSGRKIAAAAKELGLNPIWLWSGNKDFKRDLHRFETDPNCRVTVLQNRIGAFSLDGLQIANYTFFYESPVAVIDREQAERRLRRQGQLRKVFQYDLIVKGSVDAKILAFHREGEALLSALLKNPSMLKNGV